MSMEAVMELLAELYSDEGLRHRFLEGPEAVLQGRSLEPVERAALLALDPVGLELAGRSFDRKRHVKGGHPARWRRLLGTRS